MPEPTDPSFDQARYEQAVRDRDDKLQQFVKPENDASRYNEQIAQKKQEAEQLDPTDARRSKLQTEASGLEQKQQEAARRSAALESDLATSKTKLESERNKIADPAQREQLKDQDIRRQADIHREASGATDAPQTRANSETIVRYGDDRSMSQRDVQDRFKAVDLSKPVTREKVEAGTELTQEVQIKPARPGDTDYDPANPRKASAERNWNDQLGQSFSTPGNGAQNLGIVPPERQGPDSKSADVRHHRRFVVDDGQSVDALKFTPAATKDTWTDRSKRQDVAGGGTEYYVTKDQHQNLKETTYYQKYQSRDGQTNEVVHSSQLDGTRVAETRENGKETQRRELDASRENRHDRARDNRRGETERPKSEKMEPVSAAKDSEPATKSDEKPDKPAPSKKPPRL